MRAKKERYNLLYGKGVRLMTDENLIDWVAVLAYEGLNDWSFLKEEILRRLRARRRSVSTRKS
jgi:hypothetical protein